MPAKNESGREAQSETREIPALTLRADVRPGSVDVEKRTVDIIWSTGARVLRGYYDQFYEELSLDPKHVRMTFLASGRAPVLNTHARYSMNDVIGVVESARIDGKHATATLRFAKAEDDPEADKIFRKIQDGIGGLFSVGYRIHKLEKVEAGEGKIPVYRATDWEPFELSPVPIPADVGAHARSQPELPLGAKPGNPCLFITRSQEPTSMDPIIPAATTPASTTPAPASIDAAREAKLREEAVTEERARATEIRSLVASVKLDGKFADGLIEKGVKLDAARAAILSELAKRDDAVKTEQHTRIEVGTDLKRTATREGMLNAILHRADPANKLTDVGRQFRGLSLLEMARESLAAAGVETRGMPKMELAGLALGVAGVSVRSSLSTSDFPLILADVANKTLRKAYDESPATYLPISRRVTLPDFKKVKRYQLGEAPQLKKVLEGGEFTRGSVGEGKEEYALATYGRVVAFTRQALVNDDMDAFSRVTGLFGRSARDLEGDLVWEQITSNPTMGDGVALFHATHGNLGTAGAISVTTVGEARKLMRKQKGVDAKQFINVAPKYLIVPAEKETLADQFISTAAFVAATNAEKNVFAGRLQVLAEPRLDANSATAFYLAADPGQIDIIEYGYLEGEEGPIVETRIGFDVDGMEIKCRHDFAAKVIDYRGLVKNAGA